MGKVEIFCKYCDSFDKVISSVEKFEKVSKVKILDRVANMNFKGIKDYAEKIFQMILEIT